MFDPARMGIIKAFHFTLRKEVGSFPACKATGAYSSYQAPVEKVLTSSRHDLKLCGQSGLAIRQWALLAYLSLPVVLGMKSEQTAGAIHGEPD